jgi:hypothetical protein
MMLALLAMTALRADEASCGSPAIAGASRRHSGAAASSVMTQ